jgi:polysaccharide pyruvyl transferase WcaK-like protein
MRIGLLDHMGYGNLGDAAIQDSFMSAIKAAQPTAVLIGFSLNPEDTRQRHKIESYPIRWCYPGWNGALPQSTEAIRPESRFKSFVKQCKFIYVWAKPIHDIIRELAHLVRSYHVLRSLDLLVMTGGGQLCELWGGVWAHPYNVFKFCVLAKLAKTPVFIVGVGAGPLDHTLSRFFARWSVRLAAYSSFRDVESQALIRSIGAKSETHVCPDPAYALNLQSYLNGTPQSNVKPKVGINPMGFCDPRIWPRKNSVIYNHYIDNLATFISWLITHNYCVEVFTSEISVDRYAIDDLRCKLTKSGLQYDLDKSVTYRPVLSLTELFTQMSTFDFIVTPKFHGVIFSHILGKPVIALSYHPKIDDLMRTVGHHQYCLNIEQFDVDMLKDRFRALVKNGDCLRARFQRTVACYGDAVRKQFECLFVGSIPNHLKA